MCRQHTAPAAWYRCSYVLTHTRQKNVNQILNLGRFSLWVEHTTSSFYIDVHRLWRIISNPQVDQPVNMHSYQTLMQWDITQDSSSIAHDMTCLPQDTYDQYSGVWHWTNPAFLWSDRDDDILPPTWWSYKSSYDERLRPIRTKVRQLDHWLKVSPWKLSVCKAHYYR